LLPEERPPGRSNSQRGSRHGPGQSACRADAAGTQSGRAHAAPAPFQAAGRPDEFYQAAAGVGHGVTRCSHCSAFRSIGLTPFQRSHFNYTTLRYDSCARRILRLLVAHRRAVMIHASTRRNRPRKGRIFIRMDVDAIDGGCLERARPRHVFFVQYLRAISPDRRKGTHRAGGGRGVERCAAMITTLLGRSRVRLTRIMMMHCIEGSVVVSEVRSIRSF